MEKEKWFAKDVKEVEQKLGTDLKKGLSSDEVVKRQEKYGFNELKAAKKKTLLQRFLDQFKDFSIIILIIAAIVSGAVGIANGEGVTDTIIIMIVVIVNAIIGVSQEAKAEKSLEALQKLTDHAAKVIRNENITVIPAKELVPGDIVVLDTGDYIPADLRVIEAVNLKAQESSLTGESVPVEKNIEKIENNEVGIGDRVNMLFSSSLVTYGRGKGIVVETGMTTEVGKIAGMINDVEKQETPLQTKLNKLGKTLGIVALAICVFIFIVGLIQGKEPIGMFMTAVSLAVAAIPEGLAAVSTIVLAIGVQKMVKKNAIVKRLPAVETLGSATVICSDKTGTLTQNKMTVKKIFWNDAIRDLDNIGENEIDEELKKLVYANMLCNDTKISNEGELTGDPTETALVDMAFKLDFDPSIYDRTPRIEEVPFDSERKLMTTVNKVDDDYVVYTKGGIDELLKRCNSYEINNNVNNDLGAYINKIRQENEKMAKEALRVLGCAYKVIDHFPSKEEMKNIENNLTFIGMVGMIDPPRQEAKVAVEKCKTAGIKTVMITGDHKITATAIARELGILENDDEAITGQDLENMTDEELEKNVRHYSVYARVSPEHKVRIVKAWQNQGQVVAMTGDGVNDSPALKAADIGCAMGITGTDVAKGAASMILTDDNFATIITSIKEGRGIFDNIKKDVQFLLSSNIGEVLTIFGASIISLLTPFDFGVPLLPIHLLWVNLITDSLPAFALGMEPVEPDVMERKPRDKNESFFSNGLGFTIAWQGIMIGILTLIAYAIGNQIDHLTGMTMAFITLCGCQLVHSFNVKSHHSILNKRLFNNVYLWESLAAGLFLQVIIITIPELAYIFKLQRLHLVQWLICIGLCLSTIVICELVKLFHKSK